MTRWPKSEADLAAKDIVALLADKHSADVFVPECKDGPTWAGAHLRLDAWALKRTWSPVTSIGYEIKVSRSDFLSDEKWPAYLDLCHQFYFVAPAGVIEPDELPAHVGLLRPSKTGSRLYTKKKAQHRNIDLPSGLLIYILMSRAIIAAKRPGELNPTQRPTTKERMQAWLATKDENRRLAHDVSQAIRDYVARVEKERDQALRKAEGYELLENRARELGFDVTEPLSKWGINRRMQELSGAIPESLMRQVRHVAAGLERLTKTLEEIKTRKDSAA